MVARIEQQLMVGTAAAAQARARAHRCRLLEVRVALAGRRIGAATSIGVRATRGGRRRCAGLRLGVRQQPALGCVRRLTVVGDRRAFAVRIDALRLQLLASNVLGVPERANMFDLF